MAVPDGWPPARFGGLQNPAYRPLARRLKGICARPARSASLLRAGSVLP
jgi:hypothetical protein